MVQMIRMEIACLAVVVFIAVSYFSAKRRKSNIHKLFSVLIVVSIINLVFDAITLYTVNHREFIPDWLNTLCHMIFITSIGAVLYCIFRYIMVLIMESGVSLKAQSFWWLMPIVFSVLCVLTLPILYVDTEQGSYSAGTAVICAYLSVGFYLAASVYMLVRYWKRIAPNKRIAIILALGFQAVISTVQMLVPTSLISGMGVMLLNLAFYLTVENPDTLLIEQLQYEKERANAANQAKTTFIAHVSHEVRTPINAVIGMNEMILRETKDAKTYQYATDIALASHNLLSIINDVLDMSKMESGKLEIIPVKYELSKLVLEVTNMIRVRSDAKKLEFRVFVNPRLPSVLYGDDLRIRQILLNLLSNAVKYTHQGYISLWLDGKVIGDTVFLSCEVRDTGIGIKEDDLSKLYVAFERIEERRNRNIEGTGLGINITALLLKLMGSTLKVESIYGEGTRFYFEISQRVLDDEPVGEWKVVAETLSKEDKTTTLQAPGAKILMVDDNDMNRKVFRSLLSQTGMEIVDVASGRECLEMVKEKEFQMIFLDHMMPDMDGIETLHALQQLEKNKSKHASMIMLTANAMQGIREQYEKEGFDGYLSKPILPDELEQLIRDYLPQSYRKVPESDIRHESTLPTDKIHWEEAYKHLPTKEILQDTFYEFWKSIDKEADRIEQYACDVEDSNNLENYQIKVHALKSTAAMIGAMELSEKAKELEQAARNRDFARIRENNEDLLKEYREYKQILSGICQKPGTLPVEKWEEFESLCKTLQICMDEMDLASAQDTLMQLEQIHLPREMQGVLAELKESVLNNEPDQVSVLLKTLEKSVHM